MNCWYGMFRTSTPSNATRPSVASQNPAMSFATVDLPEPLGPTMAVICPGCVSKLTPCSTSAPSW